MTELLEQPLAKIVTEQIRTAAVFEKYNLDFCCKGKRSLQEACREKKLNPAHVLLDLEKALAEEPAEKDFNAIGLPELIGYILEKHHAYVNREMPVIMSALQKIRDKHGSRHPELLRIAAIFEAIMEEMDLHMKKEEKILFPRILEAEKWKGTYLASAFSPQFINAPVSVMEDEHEHAGAMMQDIRDLSNNYCPPEDACTTYRVCYASLQAFEEDLHRHVHLENNILFKKAIELF